MITAKILLDSLNPVGDRLTTWILTYPRMVHSEFMTHRVFSRNASSSRAIPVKKMLEDVKTNPALPVYWGKNQAGMQAAEELNNTEKKWTGVGSVYRTDREQAEFLWLKARDEAILNVEEMVKVGLHKQIANRLLEPWMHITVIATATQHQNFFALRAHKDAQPEFQSLAYLMLNLYQSSEPKRLAQGEWHIPFGDQIDERRILEGDSYNKSLVANASGWDMEQTMEEMIKKIATARCARVSYLNFEGKDDYEADIALADRLSQSGHWSPFEHCAQALPNYEISGNFIGWKQYRKFFNMENRGDGAISKISNRKNLVVID
jgi:thymidylate synthase ThyX